MSVRHPMAGAVLGLAALVVSLAAVNLVLRQAGYTTTLRYARMAVEHEATADSWRPMLQALDARDRGEPVYETVFFADRVKFQYPLTTLFLPMAMRSPSRTGNTLIKALNRASLAASLVFVACTAALFILTWFGARPDWRAWPTWIGLGTIVAGSVLFHPALMSYVLGQIQSFVNAALAAMLLAWWLNRRVAAGVALGIACLIKPHFALLIVWGLLRRAWSFAASAAVVIAIGGASALAVFGVRDNLDYARVVSYMAARGEAIAANQSVNGLLNRLVQPPEARDWDFHSFPPPHPVVRTGTLVAAFVLVGAALFLPYALGFGGTALDMAIAGLSVTMASPIAWDHHYGILLPALVLAAGLALRLPAARRWWLLVLGIAFALGGSLWEPLAFVEDPPANIVQSYVLAAGAAALFVMYRLGPVAARAAHPAGE
jgi:alpha-1,2-mannosyltransferase